MSGVKNWLRRVLLGPVPCHGCRTLVAWDGSFWVNWGRPDYVPNNAIIHWCDQ